MATSMDIVTLDNFTSRMPPWDANLPNHLYALVDMGSNGIRFSISDLSPPYTRLLKCLYRERAAISLFDALSESPSTSAPEFPPDVISRVSQTLTRFKSIASEFGVPAEHIYVFATEAMRKASNALSMLNAIRSESGLHVHILAPEVETLFGSMGARSGFATVNGLFLDLGGGSVQMTYMNSDTTEYGIKAARIGKSLPFGAARLMNILDKNNSEVQATALDELSSGMHGAFSRLQQEFPALRATQVDPDGSGINIYLCGGGFRGYGSILMHNDPIQPYPIPTIGAYTVKGSFFKETTTMRKVNDEFQGKIFGMSKRRRQQFPAIATVVDALVGAVPNIRTVTFCTGGNREGLLFMKLPVGTRETCPLPLLHNGSSSINTTELAYIIGLLQSALPSDIDHSNIPTVLSLGLGSLFASEIWSGSGEPDGANVSYQLHHSLARDPGTPGFTHLARSLLGLTLCFRWGAVLGPIDQQLFLSLCSLVGQASPEAIFWAEYIGEVARLIFKLFPRAPPSQKQLDGVVRFGAKFVRGKNKTKLQLTITLNSVTYQVLDSHDVTDSFNRVGKSGGNLKTPCDKVEVLMQATEL